MLANTSQDNAQERNAVWARIAAGNELIVISSLDPDCNHGKPGSPLSVSLIKLASIMKGAGRGHIDPAMLRARIHDNAAHLYIDEREIDRQWQRAMRQAVPRYPQPTRGAGFAIGG